MNRTPPGATRIYRATLVTICLAALLTVSSCANETDQDDSALTESNSSAGEYPDRVLPLDEFILSPRDWYLGNYAENLLVERCMNSRGYEWPIPRIDSSSLATSEVQSPSGRKLFNGDIASHYGYHVPEWLPPEIVVQEQKLNSEVLSPSKQAALDSCILVDARESLPLPENYTQLAARLSNDVLERAIRAPSVAPTIAEWRDCMAPEGIADLPDDPYQMPPASVAERSSLGDPNSEASAEEIRIAEADAACRESSGFDNALFSAERDLQQAVLDENADQLVAERSEGEAYMERVHEILAQFGS